MKSNLKMRSLSLFITLLGLVALFSGVTGAAAQSCIEPPSGLIGWWPADGDGHDLLGGNDATLQNGGMFGGGMADQAFLFDGVDDFALVPDSSNLNFGQGQDFTIDAWINIQSPVPGHDEEIVVKIKHAPDGFSGGYAFRVFRDTRLLMFQVTPDGFTVFNMFSQSGIPLNTWTHVAAVRQGATGLLYIDGTLDAVATLSDASLANTWPLSIGGLYDTRFFPPVQRDHVFGGSVDEVEIFNRALTTAEIRTIFEAGSAGKCKTQDSDGDGIPDELDVCSDTEIRESVPTRRLGVNRFALVDDDGVFDTTPPPGGGRALAPTFTLEDTAGCSCEQIIGALSLGSGHEKFGCSKSAMEEWVALIKP